MTRADLARAAGGIARVMARDRDTHAQLVDGFLILTEALIEVATAAPLRKQSRIERLAKLETEMGHCTVAQRKNAVMEDQNIRKSYYHEIRAAATEQGLLEGLQSGQSTVADRSRTASASVAMVDENS